MHIIRELDLVTFHMNDNLSEGTSKVDVGSTGAWYSL